MIGTWRSPDGVNYYYDSGYYNAGNANGVTFIGVGWIGPEPEPSREQLLQWFEEGEPARLVSNRLLVHLLQARAKLRSWLRGARKGPEV